MSPSKYHWINYDEEKLDRSYISHLAARRGSELHKLAHDLIRLGVKLPSTTETLNSYVNDAIGYRMTPEQPLYYSENSFGHADTIAFRRNILRIHDLKTGKTPVSDKQLLVYAALFCLEYKLSPIEFSTELRIYQNDEVFIFEPEADMIFHVMDRIITFDKRIQVIKEEAL